MNVMHPRVSQEQITARLVEQAHAVTFDQLSPETVTLAQQCVLDYLGVTLAGVPEPASQIVYAEAIEQGGTPIAHLIGRGDIRLPALSAALVNGTTSHALDFDDVNLAMPGHPSVAILPALLALGEELHADGAAIVAAFVAGYELQCRLGRLLAPHHYDDGFHPTGTIGTFGAAVACSHLLQFDRERMAIALGIAGTQAAGLKSMFGTMCKPLHAGKAAANGLLAARLARRGFDSRPNVIEIKQGFATTHSADYNLGDALADPPRGTYLRQNLFKYHAACYLVHATIEATRSLRIEHRLIPADIKTVQLRLDRSCDSVCNILEPKTGLEAKFSLRHACAMALVGVDTAALESYTDARAADQALIALRQKVGVDFMTGWSNAVTEIDIELTDGRRLSARHDAGIPASDVAEQGCRIDAKFRTLAGPLLGMVRTERIIALTAQLGRLTGIGELARLCS